MKVNIQLSSVKKEENRELPQEEDVEIVKLDRRLQRLQRLKEDPDASSTHNNNQLNRRRRRTFEPEVIEEEPTDRDANEDNDVEDRHASIRERLIKQREEEDDESEQVAEHSRHLHLQQQSQQLQQHHQQQSKEPKKERESSESEESEDFSEEESSDEEDSEDEFNSAPRIKPVFVRKENRTSIIDQRKEAEERAKQEELKARKSAEERRKEALRIIESTVQKEKLEKDQQSDANFESINSVKTDDESDEVAYLNWKLRELKRNKRDKEEREAFERLKEETERLRNMTEEERLEELKKNPKVITNQQERGKYRFMQKYYHRGAFFLDQDEEVLKRDVTKPTLEDHFDKSVLPKVMQVKNFGRSGQTKYTHLVDQDTTDHSSPWYSKDQTAAKNFFEKHGGGMKQVFERPSKKRKNEVNGGITYQKLGFVDVDLAEFAGCGLTSKMFLLEGYKDTKIHRQDNSTLKVQVDCNLIKGDPLFKRPSKSNSSFYISSISSGANSKDNTIENRSDNADDDTSTLTSNHSSVRHNRLGLTAKDSLVVDGILNDKTLTNELTNSLRNAPSIGQSSGTSGVQQPAQSSSSQIIPITNSRTAAEDLSGAGSMSSGSGSIPYMKNLDQRTGAASCSKASMSNKIPSTESTNSITNADNQIVNFLAINSSEADKNFETNSHSGNSSSASSKVSDGYGSLPCDASLPSPTRHSSGESSSNLISSSGLVTDSPSKLGTRTEQTNSRSISSRQTNTLTHPHQSPTSFNNNNQQQFSTLQPNQYKIRNSFHSSKPINISLNELDSKVDLPKRVNCEELINEIIEKNLNENDLSVNENEVGLQLYVAKDGTAKLGSRTNAKSRPKSLRMVKSSNEVSLLTTKQPLPFQKISK